MNYDFIFDVLKLAEEFETSKNNEQTSIQDFINWVGTNKHNKKTLEPNWEAKENGRSAESVINTLIVSMNRYAKYYSKSVIQNTFFASQDDFIYLINLNTLGSMTKMQLIKKNLQDKATGIQIINRLLKHNFITQKAFEEDKRSHLIEITEFGKQYLEDSMSKIRKATQIVAGDLTYQEKNELIYLLNKLDKFHNKIYFENHTTDNLLDNVTHTYFKNDTKKE